MYKTIHFYKMSINQFMTNNLIKEREFYNILDKVISNSDEVSSDNPNAAYKHYYSIATTDKKVIVDFLTHNRDYLFGSIGNIKEKFVLERIRNLKDLTSERLLLNPENALEAYTYFLLDYKTGIISFINSKSAPNIKYLGTIIQEVDMNYEVNIYPIRNENVQGVINDIKKCSAVEIKVARPPSELLGKKGENALQRAIYKVIKQDFQKFSIRLETDNSLKADPGFLNSVIAETYQYAQNDKSLEKISVTANIKDEVQKTVNLLELYFTKSIKIKVDENFSENDIYSMLMVAYNEIKEDLLCNVHICNPEDDD